MEYKGILMVCDLDNTVVTNNKISDVDLASAIAFTAKGGLLTVATGRLRDSAKRFVNMLGVNCPVICQNGGYIYDFAKNEEVFSVFLNNCAYDITREIMCLYPEIKVQIYSHQKIYFIGYDELPGGPEWYKIVVNSMNNVPKPWAKVLFCETPNVLEKLKVKAKTLDKNSDFVFVNSSECFFEMLPNGINKGVALEQLVKIMDIDIKKVIAIGDNENDIELIQKAGCGLAVKDALEELKKVADLTLAYSCGNALYGTLRMLKNDELPL